MQLRQHQQQLDKLNIDVKVVAFDDKQMADEYASTSQLSWPVLIDQDRKLYEAYGMSTGSWLAVFNPVSVMKYIRLIIAGTTPGRPGKDWRQLGGDVLIDPTGIVRLHHVSSSPHDRPELGEIFNIVTGNQGFSDQVLLLDSDQD